MSPRKDNFARYFDEIVKEAASYWRRLGRILRLTDEEIDQISALRPYISIIRRQCSITMEDQMRLVLCKWALNQIRDNGRCDVEVLLNGLSRAGLLLLAARIRRLAYSP